MNRFLSLSLIKSKTPEWGFRKSGRQVRTICGHPKDGRWISHNQWYLWPETHFYHNDNDNRIWCASQPHLIAKSLGLNNEDTRRQFQQLPLFQGEEYWYPGTLTLFDNIYHLLPNHYLDIISGKAHRYWPRKVLTSISMSECLPIVSEILSNIIEGASYRFNLAFAISSGLDSRTLFSTTRKVANKIKYFSFSSNNADKLSPDAEIPAKMLRDLRLEHHVISPSTDIDREFLQVFKKTIFTARQKKVMHSLSFYSHLPVK